MKDQEQKRAGTYFYYDEVSATADATHAREKARKELKDQADKEKLEAEEPAKGERKKRTKGKTKRDESDED